ncbi:MAG: hypothetical protein J6M02_03655 [Clostridia bacterium]|nr:hypothetical protein [Clostridia bacterium]
MGRAISFPGQETSSLALFERQIKKCPYNTSTLRVGIRSLKNENKAFFVWESENPSDTQDKMTFQQGTSFAEAESFFLKMLSIMGNAKWCCNTANVRIFLKELNNTTATIHEQATMLPTIPFTRK